MSLSAARSNDGQLLCCRVLYVQELQYLSPYYSFGQDPGLLVWRSDPKMHFSAFFLKVSALIRMHKDQ